MKKFVICVKNKDFPASLELSKVYRVIQDKSAEKQGMLRVVDESGEDYLFPEDYFVPIAVPEKAARVLAAR